MRYLWYRANSGEDAVRRGQRQVEQVKLKMGMAMDDKTFQASLLETQVLFIISLSLVDLHWDLNCFGPQVLLTKDNTKWNFETLQELVEGPLLNPKRMEEAIKGSRFIRRLMSFFHPFSHRFSDMPRNKVWLYCLHSQSSWNLILHFLKVQHSLGSLRMFNTDHTHGESGWIEVLIFRRRFLEANCQELCPVGSC